MPVNLKQILQDAGDMPGVVLSIPKYSPQKKKEALETEFKNIIQDANSRYLVFNKIQEVGDITSLIERIPNAAQHLVEPLFSDSNVLQKIIKTTGDVHVLIGDIPAAKDKTLVAIITNQSLRDAVLQNGDDLCFLYNRFKTELEQFIHNQGHEHKFALQAIKQKAIQAKENVKENKLITELIERLQATPEPSNSFPKDPNLSISSPNQTRDRKFPPNSVATSDEDNTTFKTITVP